MNVNELPDVLNVIELADLLRVDKRTVLTYIKTGKIPALKVGRQYRIAKANIMFLLGGAQ